jgi:two-component system, sporulation sensor kinase D
MVRVFINLIQNAIDAMPEGGTLQIKSTQADENTEISFTDNGSGIPEETLAKLFTPLVTTKAKGMGFGLAICKRILEVHKGKITIKSVVGKGTTVSVIIPTEPMRKEEKEQMWVNVPEAWVSITRT